MCADVNWLEMTGCPLKDGLIGSSGEGPYYSYEMSVCLSGRGPGVENAVLVRGSGREVQES